MGGFVSKGYYKMLLDGLDPDRDICNWEEIVILFETVKKLRGIGRYEKGTVWITLMFKSYHNVKRIWKWWI